MKNTNRIQFKTVVIVFVGLMILGQIVGAYAIRNLFIQSQIKVLLPQLINISDSLSQNQELSVKAGDFIILGFDLNHNMINQHAKNHELAKLDEKLMEQLLPYSKSILLGNTIAKVEKLTGLNQTSLVLGVPIIQQDDIVGTVFLLKPSSDYQAALTSFYIVFLGVTSIAILIVLWILKLYMQQSNKMDQLRKTYIDNIGHELRTPLSSLRALSEALLDDVVKDEQAKNRYYLMMINESKRLETLIKDMLELSRLQSIQHIFDKEAFEGEMIIETINMTYERFADEMGITFQISDNARMLPNVYSNFDRIIQVLHILLNNAFRHCGEEGHVLLDAKIEQKKVVIIVRNDGSYIPKDVLPHVFERFYKSNSDGSGLGLAIAKEIIDGLNETINIVSSKKNGTICSFTISRTNK